ncbi:FkbM family methyltransferase [Microbulbifer bruguierae]|uniref:FkbM family methyltransferase n=1 Tax=Microbulbifer bruguierae TaxID=3029061 RepID=A0ABY8N889_9GAMM|nr:FkbM family methyltransferase [Microbulbifer bruguierae]WGL15121.1 FkbM family methyltransferase [Microbulbifer bruguierae]
MDQQARQISFSESILSFLLRGIPIKHGKHRILDILSPRIWNKSGKPVTFSLNTHKVTLDPHDLVGWHFFILKSFDPEVIEVLEKACDPNAKEVFWDIGANKGACFSSLAAKLPMLQVVAIEPQQKLRANNVANLESICAGRYEYVQAGVGDEPAKLTLVVPNANFGAASLHVQEITENDEVEEIEIKTASQIAERSRFGWPSVIKIDVEGHEAQVFRSLKPCIESGACKAIVFENHLSEAAAFKEIKTIIEPYVYRIYGIKKSPWSTTLVPTGGQLPGVTDYAVIRSDLVTENSKLAKLVAQ